MFLVFAKKSRRRQASWKQCESDQCEEYCQAALDDEQVLPILAHRKQVGSNVICG
jgi:hypothetical protein